MLRQVNACQKHLFSAPVSFCAGSHRQALTSNLSQYRASFHIGMLAVVAYHLQAAPWEGVVPYRRPLRSVISLSITHQAFVSEIALLEAMLFRPAVSSSLKLQALWCGGSVDGQ